MTRVITAAMWCLVACGPLALLTVAAQHEKPSVSSTATPAPSATDALGPAGFAQRYVTAYLRMGGTASALKAFYPGAPDLTAQSGSRQVTATTVAGITQVSAGYWSVAVAAEEAMATGKSLGLHYFLVAVISSGTASSPSYVATALPAEVGAPPQAAGPQLGYDTATPVPSGPLTAAVTQFLAAYLTGSGNLSRYLAPHTSIAPVSPAPYASIPAVSVYTPAGTASPGEVLAQVQATDSQGDQWPLTYALTLASVNGQWDVAALNLAPARTVTPLKGR